MSALIDIASEEIKMEMTPMIDVTFLLLIFFLCTLKFKVLEGKLAAYLPKDVGVNSSPAEPKEKVEVVINVRKAGDRVFAGDPNQGEPWQPSVTAEPDRRFEIINRRIQYQIGPRKTEKIDELQDWLEVFFRQDEESPTTIDCRPGTMYGDMVPVLDSLANVGFLKVTFVGEYKQPNKK